MSLWKKDSWEGTREGEGSCIYKGNLAAAMPTMKLFPKGSLEGKDTGGGKLAASERRGGEISPEKKGPLGKGRRVAGGRERIKRSVGRICRLLLIDEVEEELQNGGV